MKILVTGAAGFIGSRLAQMLAQRGDEVVGIDNIRPIYWECWSECDGVEVNNNFSWSELEPFVNSKRLK
jgi:nucleoside-diphosphate-sugar epimerase